MSARTTIGYAFKSPMSLSDMEQALKTGWPRPFEIGDSDRYGDYLGGRVSDEAVAKIYDVRGSYVVNLAFASTHGDVPTQLAAAKHALLNKVLPLLSARDVVEAEPLD